MARKEAFSDLLAAGQREKHVDEGKCKVVVAHELPPGPLTRPCRGLIAPVARFLRFPYACPEPVLVK